MRLLQLDKAGVITLTEDFIDAVPPYAILSHTWGNDGDEVLFADLTNGQGKQKPGYRKLQFCADRATLDGLNYFWVDTCCIDKKSSAELAEAINSMFHWYQRAAKCYVYLVDVALGETETTNQAFDSWGPSFRESRWYTRGWTLQELLAPSHVEFFSMEGTLLGDKSSLKVQIHEITGIPIDALEGRSPLSYSIIERFKWAEHRRTKRQEDKAYSLLGLFGVHMPLLYGEGFQSAFHRLCETVNRLPKYPPIGLDNGQSERSHSHRIIEDERIFASRKEVLPTVASQQEVEKRLLQHLKFPAIRDREERISRALTNTFEWIYLERVSEEAKWTCFVQWLQSDNGLYWITGKAGSGKSTLMKFLHLDPRTANYLNDWTGSSKLVVAGHFFWNSGNSMQMSIDGLLRTILYEIVQSEGVSILDLFPERWEEIRSNLVSDGTPYEMQPWTTSECLQALRRLLLRPFNTLRFFFFVDGLDEFSGDHTELIELLKEMADSSHIKMCVASRPWSVFQDAFDTGPHLILQRLTLRDIKHYVDTKFYENRGFVELQKGNSLLAAQLIESITEKASGVFLWVRLAVQSLLRGLANGDRMIDLARRLEDLPEDLEMLFRKILDSIDPAYKVHSSQLFQLHRAANNISDDVDLLLLSYADDDDQALWEEEDTLLGADEFLYRIKSMERRLDSRTKGLLEAPTTIVKEIEPQLHSMPDSWSQAYAYGAMNPTVQYLHRTLKDYIEQPRIWTQICSSAPSFSSYPSLCKAYALKIKGMDYSINEIFEENAVGLWLQDGAVYAMRSCQLTNRSEQKNVINTLDALNAILTRKFVPESQTSIYHPPPTPPVLMPVAVMFDIHFWIEAWFKRNRSATPTSLGLLLCYALHDVRVPNLPGISPGISLALSVKFRMSNGPNVGCIETLLSNGASIHDEFEGSSAWDLVVAILHSKFPDAKTIHTKSKASTEWLDVTEIFLRHGASSERLRSGGLDHVCQVLDARKNAGMISETAKELEDEGNDEVDNELTEEKCNDPVNENHPRRKRQRTR